MNTSLPALCLAALGWCCPVAALAQAAGKPGAAAPGKISTLGDAKAGSRLLTREELRQCLARQTALGERRPKVEAERDAVQRELDEIKQIDQSLKADAAAVDTIKVTIASLNDRTQELSRKVADFNQRIGKFQDAGLSGPSADRQRAAFDSERAALDSSAKALDVERSAFSAQSEQALKTYNARIASRDQSAGEWNAKSARTTQLVQDYEKDRQAWAEDCAGRPYREDDEAALKAGK